MMSGMDTTMAAAAMATAKTQTIDVRIRSTEDAGGRATIFECPIPNPKEGNLLEQLKRGIVEKLGPYWSAHEFDLSPDHIKVFSFTCDRDPKEVKSDQDLEPSKMKTFWAFEYFTKEVPVDLFRTVMRQELEPSTLARYQDSPWTRVCPLFCTGLTSAEAEMPWLKVNSSNGKIEVGVCLFLCGMRMNQSCMAELKIHLAISIKKREPIA
jgi:hypothetical protein